MSVLHRFRIWRKNPIVDLVVTIITAVVIAYLVQLWVVKPFRVPSESMEPTLQIGDRIIAARFLLRFEDPKRGDILVFHPNGNGDTVELANTAANPYYVKRLIGLPGETVGSTDGHVWVCTGAPPQNRLAPDRTPGCRYLSEPYVHGQGTHLPPEGPGDMDAIRLGRDQYFMMGDNRTNSADSRVWGPIHRAQIVGLAFMTYWPLDRFSFY